MAAAHSLRNIPGHPTGRAIGIRSPPYHFFPVYATRQTAPEPSSVTINDPSLATATPAGRPQTLPSLVTKPTRKSSNSPVALPSFIGTRMTLYPVRRARFHEPCSEAKAS